MGKGRFHGTTNHDEWQKTADDRVPTQTKWCERFKEVPDECLWSSHCTVVTDILMDDQLHFFIVLCKTCLPPELRLSPFVIAYMAPRPSDEFPLIGGQFALNWSAREMAP